MRNKGLKETLFCLRDIVAEVHKWCGTDFWDLASLDPLWNGPPWDIKNRILKVFFLHSGGLKKLIFQILTKTMKLTYHGTFACSTEVL